MDPDIARTRIAAIAKGLTDVRLTEREANYIAGQAAAEAYALLVTMVLEYEKRKGLR